VYCNEKNVHHRSLCPVKFKKSVIKESAYVTEEGNESEISKVKMMKMCFY
jgi:hypothetical protein